ncbi:MAG: hypothetical protein GTO63_09375 [Anaerolineae bacterium]|nr:hypothetical protein [Anaerolineae bacterium]NIN95095.1 hypothetical protein [Anaerolineae bacterium]NIQ78947.1 hypothetical protein [Anaerolineae bacterium]
MKPKIFVAATAVALTVALRAPAPAALTAPQPQSIVVTSSADSGPGSFREALTQAPAGTHITFDAGVFPPDSPATVFVLSPLPELTQGQVTIDASDAGVILDGSQMPLGEWGSGLTISSSGNVIRGLQILHFPAGGLSIERGAQHNFIGGDRTKGAGPTGQGNVISGTIWAPTSLAALPYPTLVLLAVFAGAVILWVLFPFRLGRARAARS